MKIDQPAAQYRFFLFVTIRYRLYDHVRPVFPLCWVFHALNQLSTWCWHRSWGGSCSIPVSSRESLSFRCAPAALARSWTSWPACPSPWSSAAASSLTLPVNAPHFSHLGGDRAFTRIPILCTSVMLYWMGRKLQWSIFTLLPTLDQTFSWPLSLTALLRRSFYSLNASCT